MRNTAIIRSAPVSWYGQPDEQSAHSFATHGRLLEANYLIKRARILARSGDKT
jgi:hypothetical protein